MSSSSKRSHHHHKKKKHHKKHHHKKHRKKRSTDRQDKLESSSFNEVILDDQKLLQALASIDNELLNTSSNSSNDEEEKITKDESTGQHHVAQTALDDDHQQEEAGKGEEIVSFEDQLSLKECGNLNNANKSCTDISKLGSILDSSSIATDQSKIILSFKTTTSQAEQAKSADTEEKKNVSKSLHHKKSKSKKKHSNLREVNHSRSSSCSRGRDHSGSRNQKNDQLQQEYSRSKRSYSRSRSCSKSRTEDFRSRKDHFRSRKDHFRSRSYSKSRSRSRSRKDHFRSRKDRFRSRSYSKSRSRSRSRKNHFRSRKDRFRSKSYSRSRSRSRLRKDHFRSRGDRLRSRSYSRSRSRSRSRKDHFRSRKRVSRSRSCSRSRRSRRRHYSGSSGDGYREYHRRRRKSSLESSSSSTDDEKKDSKSTIPVLISKTKGKDEKIAQLTEFCRHLSKLEKVEDPTTDGSSNITHHPFQVGADSSSSKLLLHNQAWKTAEQLVAESNAMMDQRPVEQQFPVSSGINHKNEVIAPAPAEEVSVDEPISTLVVQRATLQQKLKANSSDVEAIIALSNVERKLASWSQGQVKPGLFTGGKEISPMPKWEHDRGYQAWAKKDMFKDLAPVMSGFGMKMLMKMGWESGKPLGKRGEGYIEPIPVDVKIDRQGLVATEEKQPVASTIPSGIPPVTGKSSLAGKHPVSALQELCTKKGWAPDYKLISETGPSHMKSFMYKVTVEGLGTFQAACSSNNKKLAKAQAAIACLKSLGLFEDDTNKQD